MTGVASGPRPRETLKYTVPLAGFTAMSLMRMSSAVVPSTTAILPSMPSTATLA